jgi:hypothetical protein
LARLIERGEFTLKPDNPLATAARATLRALIAEPPAERSYITGDLRIYERMAGQLHREPFRDAIGRTAAHGGPSGRGISNSGRRVVKRMATLFDMCTLERVNWVSLLAAGTGWTDLTADGDGSGLPSTDSRAQTVDVVEGMRGSAHHGG